MANRLIQGFPTTEGGFVITGIIHDGPTLYAAGGEVISAVALGMRRIVAVDSSASDDGVYFTATRLTPANPEGVASFKLIWYVSATGSEAGALDLHARFVTLIIRGR